MRSAPIGGLPTGDEFGAFALSIPESRLDERNRMPSITPSLWFDNNLEEAAQFYTSIFPNSTIEALHRNTEAGPGTPG